MSRKVYVLFFCLIVLGACKSSKVGVPGVVQKMSTDKIISKHYKNDFDFKTINARLKVKYDDGKQSFSPNVSLRIKKDETIWLSAKMLGITLAKVLITPEKVAYYEKINNTYFEGDFDILSSLLGTDLDYNKMQQLLLGQTLFDLKKSKYKSVVSDKKYKLLPKKDVELFESLLLLHPDSFKMYAQQIKQPKENRELQIAYTSYQKVGNQDFPEHIEILAQQKKQTTKVSIEYKSVDYNAKVGFPFKIPSGYEQMKLDE